MYNIPTYVDEIINKIEEQGYSAFLVGGSIRDILIGRKPNDYDITTDAIPSEIQDIFKEFKTIEVGKQFGTIGIVTQEGTIEVTTFRSDGVYKDGRRPESISFSKDIREDLKRRDFTINAIAFNKKVGLIDPFNGQEDLKNKIVRTVGNPEERFKEDYLRILRSVRLASQLEFEIEEETYKSCKKYKQFISDISAERIRDEIFKMLICKTPSLGMRILEETEILNIVLPEMIPAVGFNQRNPHHDKSVYDHILCVLDKTPPILHLRVAALFHDIGKPHTLTIDDKGIGHFYKHDKVGSEIAKKILERWKCSNELINKVYTLIGEHMTQHARLKDKGIKKLIGRVGEKEVLDLLILQKCDRSCSNENASIEDLIERENKIKEIIENKEVYNKNQLEIDGEDIIQVGYKEGKIIGDILEYLLDKVMENTELNKKDKLIELALKKFPI